MSLTPADIASMEFRQPPAGARGYHEDAVDEFLDGVAEEMQRLSAENRTLALRLQHEDMTGHLRKLERDCARVQDRVRDLRAELEKARAEAQTAEPPPSDADVTGSRILGFARRTAEERLAEAHSEGADLLRKAAVEAARVLSDAELRASTIVADARHAHAERIAGLDEKRAMVLSEIDDLVQAAHHQRDAVADDVDRRLRGMDGGTPAVTRPRDAP